MATPRLSKVAQAALAAAAAAAANPAPAAPPPVSVFTLKPPETVRVVLERWAQLEGWTFGPAYYAVNMDLPVMASDAMPLDFKAAVRVLLGSTEMTDMPVQPCFYRNNVLRVVPKSELCDRL